MKPRDATLLGFAAAPAVTAIPIALFAPLSGALDVESFLITVLVAYVFAGIATLVGAFPLYVCLRHWGLVTPWTAIACGFSIGVLTRYAITPSALALLPTEVLRDGALGAASAIGFWLLWRKGDGRSTTG